LKDNFLYTLFKRFEPFSLTYVYRGNFDSHLTDKILGLAETNMNVLGEATKTQKKVYFIMVESLQNITRHQDVSQKKENQAFFVVQNKDGRYGMASGNVIENCQIPGLQEKLDKINSLDADALKAYYKDVLENTGMSEKGGAGLGLIEIARRSGSKLSYLFKRLNDELSFFYFKTKVGNDTEETEQSRLGGAQELHDLTNSHNINMIYQGFFTHENLKSLVAMTEGSVGKEDTAFKRKATNIMVELLQNICYHGGKPNPEKEGTPGILIIAVNHNSCTIYSGNYIANTTVPLLKAKLSSINASSEVELEELYAETILKEHEPGQKGAGLGFIDIRQKSGNKIAYDFIDFNEIYSFLSVSVSIDF
jgi:hypothetical protein